MLHLLLRTNNINRKVTLNGTVETGNVLREFFFGGSEMNQTRIAVGY